MPDKDFPGIGECQNITHHAPNWDDRGRIYWKDIQTQHRSLNAKARCFLPPEKIIPVIFIPGVMGSNLMSSGGELDDGEVIWRGDGILSVYKKWAALRGEERRKLLNPDVTKVDNRGDISSNIYSPISDDGKSSFGTLLPSRRSRGWGEALALSYGKPLSVLQAALLDDWQKGLMRRVSGKEALSEKPKENGIVRQLCSELLQTEDKTEAPLSEQEVEHFSQFLYPLHVFGYNWLQDNALSAAHLIEYIEKVLTNYNIRGTHGHGLAVEKVILVTHSMGGLVARYASQVLGAKDKILGVVHGVIPDLGSPAAYRRMNVGAKQEGMPGQVMGNSAEDLMPVLARAPGPLQLLPSPRYKYGAPWLWIKKGAEDGRDLQLPQFRDPFAEIYLNQTMWWKLYEPKIIDKDKKIIEKNWANYTRLIDRPVRKFISSLDKFGYHPTTYVFYGNKKSSDGFLKWDITFNTYPKNTHESDKKLANNQREVPLSYNRSHTYQLYSSSTPGDGTVPVESLSTIKTNNGGAIKSVLATDVDHQGAYDVASLADIHQRPALKFTLRAIAKMVQEVPSPR